MTTDYMDIMFQAWSRTCKETPEFETAFESLCRNEDDIDLFDDCIEAEKKQAFAAGFSAAVQLLKLR